MANFTFVFGSNTGAAQGPSGWELLLRGIGVPEHSCSLLLSGDSSSGRAIRAWVLENYASRYVPEDILETLGLRKQMKLKWPDNH
jgi:hypothetical protein